MSPTTTYEHQTTTAPPSRTLIVIPARGGSVGVTRKNLQPVGGIPLVQRSAIAAVSSGAGDVVVSTEDAEIARAVPECVTVRMRPPELSEGNALSDDVVMDALTTWPHPIDHVVLMQCTSPFTTSDDVARVVERLKRGAQCVVSVTQMYSGIWRMHYGRDSIEPVDAEIVRRRQPRQERMPLWQENGALYGMQAELFRQTRNRFCGAVTPYVMSKHKSVEIDDLWDLHMAQRMADWPAGTEVKL